MKIGVVGTCQAAGIGMGLQQLLGDPEILGVEAVAAYREGRLQQTADALRECAVIFSHHLAPEFGPLSSDALRDSHRDVQLIPNVAFTGFHPDCIYISAGGQFFKSPMEDYHSAIAAAAFALGADVDTTLRQFNREVFARLGYFDEFAKARAFLAKTMADARLDISLEWPHWMARAPFMHSVNHPKGCVLASLAKLIAARSGLIAANRDFVDLVLDDLSLNPVWPVYPELAGALGIGGSYLFKKSGRPDLTLGRGVFIALRDFVERSFAAYAAYPSEAFSIPAVARVRRVLQETI
jgi:hypothetical protein